MKVIDCWELLEFSDDLCFNHMFYVSDENTAYTWKANRPVRIEKRQLVIYDSCEEINDHITGEARKRALTKLTDEEKIALGIK